MLRLLFAFAALFVCLPALAEEVRFSIDVMSVISKAGCNAGSCHGNLNGKGGLKLSFRGQDPEFDYRALVVAARGRRVSCGLPEQSLMLQKATASVPHTGGARFAIDSEEYRVLRDWIRAGAPGTEQVSPVLRRLEVRPASAVVVDPLHELQVQVTAHFSDGSARDVSQRACYELSNLDAEVNAHGRVTRRKFTETTLIVRYLQKQVPVQIVFSAARPNFVWNAPPANNFIDRHVFAKLERLRINPSPLCSDEVFVRRAYVDAIGRGPSAEEAQEFVFDSTADKRARLIERLLARPEFADFWALKWADVLRTEEKVLDPHGVEVFHGWIREMIADNQSLDEVVRQLVTGVGSTYQVPAANYYRANRDPSTRGETTARLFLGTRLQCAKCHNHPFDRWTQDDYYQWSSLFSQLDYDLGENNRKDRLDKNEFAGEQIVLVSKQAEVRNPTTEEIAPPKFLGGLPLPEADLSDRLHALADWLTADENELFAQSQSNFIWFHLMGRGLVDPIDDFRLTNPSSNAPLMSELAQHFVANDFDIRDLVRTIMNSRTYQLSSEPNSSNVDDATSYSHALVRRLPAEVMLDLQSDVLDAPAEFAGYDTGMRAVQIPGVQRVRPRDEAPKPGDRFLKTFGKPERIMACDCERSSETTLKQALVLLGDGLNDRLAESTNRLQRLAASNLSDSAVIDELYWTALSRPPTPDEQTAAADLLRSNATDRAAAIQDLAWALMNAKEFLFRR